MFKFRAMFFFARTKVRGYFEIAKIAKISKNKVANLFSGDDLLTI